MRRLKKYQAGEAAQYITRRAALRKLQLSLNDFRRLCIIKGVYPREPKHRRRAQKGASDVKILYHSKDIRFLLHEPIVWTLRDYKIFAKKTGRDRAVKDFRNLKRRLSLFPELRIDHIVKERYPTFVDAIKDLDDCLTLLFLFSAFPSLHSIPRDQSFLCRRLTMEFLHYIIGTQSLRNVFVSIKGFYFQADIKGHKVNWIMPHSYPFKPHSKAEIDFKLMSIFVEFYTVMLGFVNCRLYNSDGHTYPPNFANEIYEENCEDEISYISDRIAALNSDLFFTEKKLEDVGGLDLDFDFLGQEQKSQMIIKSRNEKDELKRLSTLFVGLKFFISREVPREPLVIIIKSFGGKVSWDSSVYLGATFNENDDGVTHQIADRLCQSKQYLSRDYVQPQWIFDCVNRRCLLPTNNYFVGVSLPPHLSPFVDFNRGIYSQHGERLEEKCLSVTGNEVKTGKSVTSKATSDTVVMNEDQLDAAYMQENLDLGNLTEHIEHDKKKMNMSVRAGKVYEENQNVSRKNETDEHRLKARMVKSRHRNLFRKLIREKQFKEKEKWLLNKKRKDPENTK